ncbi:MAG TPA: hypothetical protein VHJ76_00260 [Actinomycetota bacterium]|nr:hypothetical protein [Actinomycetota bacterium]
MALLAGACSWGASPEVAAPTRSPSDPLRDRAVAEGRVGVIVDLAVPQQGDGFWERADIAKAQRKLLAELPRGVRVVARYETTPQIALQLTPRALERLRASPLVLAIHLNETDEPTE